MSISKVDESTLSSRGLIQLDDEEQAFFIELNVRYKVMSFNSGIIVIILALLLVLQSSRWHTTEQHTKYVTWRLKRLEQKIDLMLNQMEIEYEDKTLEVVKDLIKSDKKVAAIKMFRQQTGVDLAEAKRAIEAIARGMR